MEKIEESLDPSRFTLWLPEKGRVVQVGPEALEVPLPYLPLPVYSDALGEGSPTNDAIGKGLYDYLRQFPDCPRNIRYAEILKEAYPHYLTDLAAQIVMLEHKEVDAPYVRRMVVYMKILLLLDPENGGLLQRLGLSCYDLALTFSEFANSREHLLSSMGYFQRSRKLLSNDLTNLNYLAQIDYYFADYPTALARWETLVGQVGDQQTKEAFLQRIETVKSGDVPDHPLVDDLEAVGLAMSLYGEGDFKGAVEILERIEEEGTLLSEIPMPELYYMLGVCREKTDDIAGAFDSFDKALLIDPEFSHALDGKDRLLDRKEI